MKIQYLEIVTPEVDAVCATYAAALGTEFGEGDATQGGAHTAQTPSGGMLGVRAPLNETEQPVVRPYVLVDDIKSAVEATASSGARVALPSLQLPDHGT